MYGKTKILALCGKKGSGKTTLADELVRQYAFVRLKMASPIKAALRAMLIDVGINEFAVDEYIEGCLKETPIPSFSRLIPRYMMQTFGTQLGRELWDEEVWVDVMRNKIRQEVGRKDIVIDDMRFPNELKMLQEFTGMADVLSVWVDRPNDKVKDTHESENSLHKDDCGIVLWNDCDVNEIIKPYAREGMFDSKHIVGDIKVDDDPPELYYD